ncbi:MAG: hypothetical protein U0324_09465 [Polyangiales bacterium]
MPSLLRATFLPALAAASLGLAWALRRARWGERGGGTAAWLATLAFACLAVRWPDANRHRVWAALVRDAPVAAQSLAGVALALAPGVLVAEAWLASAPSRLAWALLAAACGAWAAVYPALPMHLSAPDFDDFFVVDKFLGVVARDWGNDKPFFTVWDYAYRALEPLAALSPLERFRVNGWFALVYTVGLGLWLRRCFEALPDGPARRALPWLLALHLGPVVLSHTLSYELPCGAWVVAVALLLERLHESSAPPLAVIAALALARSLQAGGHNATAAAWLPVYAHGVLVLRARGASAGEVAWGVVLGASGAAGFARGELGAVTNTVSGFDAARFGRVLAWGWAPLAACVASAAAALRWREGAGAVKRWALDAWRAPRATHAAAVYLAAGAFIYLSANQDNLGLPRPGAFALERELPWDYGANHARYALFFYPALVAMLGAAALRAKPLGLALLALFPPWWNGAYVTRFYRPPPGHALIEGGYHGNSRYLALARARLRGLRSVAYLPIPRDHGDHFLALAARPDLKVSSVCGRGVGPGEPMIITSHTADVLRREGAPPGFAELAREDVTLTTAGALPPTALARWCERPSLRPRVHFSEEPITP